jgi:adenine-specific DNA-methyltransferase
MPPEGKHWQYTPDKLDALDEAGEIHWSKTGNPRRKVYLTNDKNYLITIIGLILEMPIIKV